MWFVALFGLILYGAFAVYSLASQLRGRTVAIFYILGLFIPCVGLLILFFISSRATRVLQEHGIEVGFLGAKPSEV